MVVILFFLNEMCKNQLTNLCLPLCLDDNNAKPLHGQYLHAFCAGLANALQPYQDALVQIENKVSFFLL